MKYLLLLLTTLSISAVAQKKNSPEFFLSTQKRKLSVVLEAAQFRSGDVVADVGAGLGWFDLALGIQTDSVSFVMEEIDSSLMNDTRFSEARAACEKLKGRTLTNNYSWAIGNEKSTTLPSSTFDKVLLLDTYHHIEHKGEMLKNLYDILKPGGRLIVMEPIARKADGELYKGCQSIVYPANTIISDFEAVGFAHAQTLKTVRSTRKRVRVFVFTKTSA